jgi:hypothetical protein
MTAHLDTEIRLRSLQAPVFLDLSGIFRGQPPSSGFTARLSVKPQPGQSMIYLAKEAEAHAWMADPTPDPAAYPLLSAELGITAPDGASLAQIWLNLATLWRSTAADLEALRLTASAAIDAATTPEEVGAAMAGLPA